MNKLLKDFLSIPMPLEKLLIARQSFSLKIAHMVEHRRVGLSRVDELPQGCGMLFLYGETQIPGTDKKPFVSMCARMNLTVVFLKSSGEVVGIFVNLKGEGEKNFKTASRYYCKKPAEMMLELRGDLELGLYEGDSVDLRKVTDKYRGEIYTANRK
ncbi:MAG: DUF192 domain-containing protein [Patescibacteria group bacterium]|nr:DUF192 domain-containing protein [Patescibacteria group bacterium]